MIFVKQNQSEGFSAIGFGFGNQLNNTKNPFWGAFTLEENEFNGNVTIQISRLL